jgi:hypothetical protein
MLKKIALRPGTNRETTRYTTEGGWYESNKVRFRQGTPEKIGGWERISANTFAGTCRSLWAWASQTGEKLIGVMTSLRQYVAYNGGYYDIGPFDTTLYGVASFAATPGSSIITVTSQFYRQTPGTPWVGSWVQFQGAVSLGGNITATVLNQKYTITEVVSLTSGIFKIDVGVTANSSDVGTGVTASTYAQFFEPHWSDYASQSNFGSDLIFAYRGGKMCRWDYRYGFLLGANTVTITVGANTFITTTNNYPGPNGTLIPVRFKTTGALPTGMTVNTLYYMRNEAATTPNVFTLYSDSLGTIGVTTSGSATGVTSIDVSSSFVVDTGTDSNSPTAVNYVLVSDLYRFIFALGVNDYGNAGGTIPGPSPSLISPMLIRWCDQEDYTQWTPAATNQAGSLTLSRGSEIITALQARQEVLVWTDVAVYSLQYLGAPEVWGAQLVGENISIVSQNCVAYASGVAFWMGKDKFYRYDGRTQTLRCDLRQYIFSDINSNQFDQIFAGTNEGFNEVWWFYCSADSSTINRYVIYNYAEDIWYYGTLARTAWSDVGVFDYPLAATYSNNLVYHEYGVDDNTTGTPAAITASITSAEFDLDDGDKFVFIRRILPDLTFRGSTAGSPSGVLTIKPLKNSGSGYSDPASEGGTDNATVTRTATVPIEAFTGQVYVRIRARQIAMKFESTGLGVNWQLGSMRLDMKPDGRSSGSGVSGG